jgi:hypothetical protein
MALERVPLDGEVTSVCPLCSVPLKSVQELGGMVGCEPCGCTIYSSVVTTYITCTGVYTMRKD